MKIVVTHPSRASAMSRTVIFSLVVHAIGCVAFWYYPLIATAIGLRNIEFVEESYDRTILIDFSKQLRYPPGYIGFSAPEKIVSLDEVARLDKKRLQREEALRRARERAEARKKAADLAAAKAGKGDSGNETQPQAQTAQQTPAEPPKETYPGGFGKINTAPIKEQVQTLYHAYKEGKLVLPEGKLKVGVSGRIMPDGALEDCTVIVASGQPDIDRAALAILEAVSLSKALGPLHEMSSLTMLLNVGEQQAELSIVGFTSSDEAAVNIVNLANAALLYARFKKADDPAAMVIISNLKVSRTGNRVQALIAMPRQKASESLAQTMAPPKP
jgi:hypothetical protein